MIDNLQLEVNGIDVIVFKVIFDDNMETGEVVWNYLGDERPDDEAAFSNYICEAINTLIREIHNGKPNI